MVNFMNIDSPPYGIQAIQWLFKCGTLSKETQRSIYRGWILVATFIIYLAYHAARRPLSIVKSELAPIKCMEEEEQRLLNETQHANLTSLPSLDDIDRIAGQNCSAWAPFDNPHTADQLLGMLDSCFLFAYAFGMFIAGMIAERVHLRLFLAIGMVFSGVCCWILGFAHTYNVHEISYFIVVQVAAGLVQTTGWPAVVACVSNWFGKHGKRGTIFGIWNSHTNFGNILGAILAGYYVESNWGLSFIAPGSIMAAVGILMYLFLTPYPEEVGLVNEPEAKSDSVISVLPESKNSSINSVCHTNSQESKQAVNFFSALLIPGVIEFSTCLFFSKLVSYTFLYWLPYYIRHTTSFSSENAAYMSVPFDIGGMMGAVLAGYSVDRTGSSAITCILMLICAVPLMLIYKTYGAVSQASNIVIQIIMGAFVNGPYALITTTVSAELGGAVKGNAKALATVTAIVDGMGSIGAAVGPLIASLVMNTGWNSVFYMMMAADVIAFSCLLRVGFKEYQRHRSKRNGQKF